MSPVIRKVINGKLNCKRCSETKEVNSFSKCSRAKSGYKSYCKSCCKDASYKSLQKNDKSYGFEVKASQFGIDTYKMSTKRIGKLNMIESRLYGFNPENDYQTRQVKRLKLLFLSNNSVDILEIGNKLELTEMNMYELRRFIKKTREGLV